MSLVFANKQLEEENSVHNLFAGQRWQPRPLAFRAAGPVACPHVFPGAAAVPMALVGQVGRVVWGVVLRTTPSLFVQLTQHFCELPQISLLFLFTFLLKHKMHKERTHIWWHTKGGVVGAIYLQM